MGNYIQALNKSLAIFINFASVAKYAKEQIKEEGFALAHSFRVLVPWLLSAVSLGRTSRWQECMTDRKQMKGHTERGWVKQSPRDMRDKSQWLPSSIEG